MVILLHMTNRILAQLTLKLDRNRQIYKDFCAGIRKEELAVKYHLSYNRIVKIVEQQKKLGGENN